LNIKTKKWVTLQRQGDTFISYLPSVQIRQEIEQWQIGLRGIGIISQAM
jgi:hypothetical protein